MGHSCPKNFNPADFFISVLAIDPDREKECREFVHQVCDGFQTSTEGQQVVTAAKTNMTSMANGGAFFENQYEVRWAKLRKFKGGDTGHYKRVFGKCSRLSGVGG